MGKYIKKCTNCSKKMITDNYYQKIHKKCKKKKHLYPKKFYAQRVYVYDRDKLTCRNCNKKVNNEKKNPPVHHIDGNPKNNDLNNLVLLCEQCHKKIHGNKDFVAYGKRKFKQVDYTPKRIINYKKIPRGRMFIGV